MELLPNSGATILGGLPRSMRRDSSMCWRGRMQKETERWISIRREAVHRSRRQMEIERYVRPKEKVARRVSGRARVLRTGGRALASCICRGVLHSDVKRWELATRM